MLTCLDLFAGAGGLSLGLQTAGFECVGVMEKDATAAETYWQNFRDQLQGTPFVGLGPEEGDIQTRATTELLKALAEGGIAEGELDLLCAGPPCQGFSMVGRSKLDRLASQRGAFQRDRRNRLYLDVVELLPALQPRAFLVENVPGILNHARVNVAEQMAEAAELHGYHCGVAVLNAAWYGVPQTRERVFILGFRRDLGIRPDFPPPRHTVERNSGHLAGAEWVGRMFADRSRFYLIDDPGPEAPRAVSAREAIEDLPPFFDHMEDGYTAKQAVQRPPLLYPAEEVEPGSYAELMRNWPGLPESEAVLDHYARCTPRDHETFRRMEPGDRYPRAQSIARERYAEALSQYYSRNPAADSTGEPALKDYVPPYPADSFDEKWRKLIPELPSWTVTAHLSRDGYSHIHYDDRQARVITPREAARLQSFPDAFRFAGNMGEKFRQIGDAVPPLLARELGSHVAKMLGKPESETGRPTDLQLVSPTLL